MTVWTIRKDLEGSVRDLFLSTSQTDIPIKPVFIKSSNPWTPDYETGMLTSQLRTSVDYRCGQMKNIKILCSGYENTGQVPTWILSKTVIV
jgi:hypothetical protein